MTESSSQAKDPPTSNDSPSLSPSQPSQAYSSAAASPAPPGQPNASAPALNPTQPQSSVPTYPARYYPPALYSESTNNNNSSNSIDGFFGNMFGFTSRKTETKTNADAANATAYNQMTNQDSQYATNDSTATTQGGDPLPPPFPNSSNPYSSIPPGWSTIVDPQDGRIYYFEPSTGRRSITHPMASSASGTPPTPHRTMMTQDDRNHPAADWMAMQYYDADHNPRYAHRRPDNHQCAAVAALILCFPIGLFAIYHSWQTDVAWKAGRYGDAVNHARQAPQYASWGIAIGSIFWILWFFFRRGNDKWKWPEWGNLFND